MSEKVDAEFVRATLKLGIETTQFLSEENGKLKSDLARYREAVGVAVAALESVLADRQESYVGSGLDDARSALAVLKRLS